MKINYTIIVHLCEQKKSVFLFVYFLAKWLICSLATTRKYFENCWNCISSSQEKSTSMSTNVLFFIVVLAWMVPYTNSDMDFGTFFVHWTISAAIIRKRGNVAYQCKSMYAYFNIKCL